MNREQLAHVVRAASVITGDGNILIIGSQALLGSWDDGELPDEATRSIEADVVFPDDPEELKMDALDGAIGEMSMFHQTHGYYGQGNTITTAVLPAGWEDRVVHLDREDSRPGYARCLEPHDLVIAKLVAGRDKDHEFTSALIKAELVDVELLKRRAETINRPRVVIERVLARIDRCAAGT
jgi:hypothetical protein